MADETTKINLVLQAEAELSKLRAAEMQILALIAAYKKLSDASAAASKAAQARSAVDRGGAGASPEQFKVAVADAKAELQQLEKLAKNVKLPAQAEALNKQIASLSDNVKALSDPTRGAGTIGKTLADGAVNAGKQVESLEGKLRSLQGVGGKEPKIGLIESAERNLRGLREVAGVSAPTPKASADRITEQAIERGESPRVAQARTNATRAAVAAAEAATTEATAKEKTAKASKAVAEETGKSAKNTKVVAEQTTAATKAATKVASQAAPAVTAAELQSRLGGGLRALLSQASRDPMGPVNRPTRRELEGASNLPIANKLAGKTLAGGGGGAGDGGATNALRGLAAAAERASAALSRLASSTAGSAKAAVGGAAAPAQAAAAAGQPRSAIAQLQQEVLANREAAAALHKTLRQQEALSNPRYKQAVQERAAAQVTYSRSVNDVSVASSNAARSIGGMARQQDAITGQVKNVLGMAAGYQVLQGIASELGQVFGHLKGGIMGFNSMLEQATVGFTTLFKNQAEQVYAAGEGLTAQQSLAEDVSGKIDYLRMGYGAATEAAEGMINTIREFANVTPFRFAELQESALRMRAFGFSLDEVLRKNPETKKFEGGIVAVGNAVSALGGGADAFRRITYALGQMKQAGRVYQNDMMQLANAGIGGYKYIADALKREITTDGSGSRKMVKEQHRSLFAQLESNAIETVRRLTTNGQISGEAASRAILAGLEKDFGGGMEAQAKTFQGAFSTVADTSQSLVADAFLPLYNSIRDTTYSLGQFLQRDEVRKRALEFGKAVTVLVDALTILGKQVMNIVVRSFGDLSNIINTVGDKTKATGQVFQSAFGGFASGVKVVLSLLQNDMIRSLIYAAALTKAVFAFQAANPFLAQIILVTTAIGLMQRAYNENFAGFRTALDQTVANFEPLLIVIRDKIIPLATSLGAAFSSTLFATMAIGLEAIAPAIDMIVDAIEKLLRVIKFFQGPLTALFLALGTAFVFSKIVAGFALMSKKISELMLKFDMLAQKARNAGMSMVTIPGAYGTAGSLPISYAGDKPGPSVPNASNRGAIGQMVMGGLVSKMGGIGMASMMLGGLAQFGDGAVAQIGGVVQNVGMALMGFSALKGILPAGIAGQIATGATMILTRLKAYALVNFPGIAAGLTMLQAAMIKLPVLGPAMQGLTKAMSGLSLGVVAAGVAFMAAGVAIAMAINDAQIEERGRKAGQFSGLYGPAMSNYFGRTVSAPTAEDYVTAAKVGSRDSAALENSIKLSRGEAYNVKEDKGLFGLGLFRMSDTGLTTEEEQAAVNKIAAFNALKLKYDKETQDPWVRIQRAEAAREAERLRMQSEKTKGLTKQTADAMKLLVNEQKNAGKNQEYLNWLLNKTKQELAVATRAIQTLAEGAMNELLNPSSRVNPYTGLEEAGLTLDELLQTEQEMGFTQFENASGLVKNFDEYRDLLNSILPITDKDLTNGQLSVKAVEERLKIDKERRRELEHIKAIAEAEYELGMAQLSMYDESIDPLQRGVQMRQAQMKYTEDINKLQMEGVEIILDEAKASTAWGAATKATQKRLEDLKKGQQLILDEMKDMFTDYNQDIANILSNPSLSAAQRRNQVEERTKQLYDDLEKNFGITKTMMQTQLTTMNGLIDSALAQMGNPSMPDINWGGEIANRMEAGGYKFLTDYLTAKVKRVADLTSAVFAAANPDNAIEQYAIKTRDVIVKLFKARVQTGIAEGKLAPDTGLQSVAGRLYRDIAYFAKTTGFENLVNFQNVIESKLKNLGLARGGYTGAGRLRVVGEEGPELFVPRSNGMVLSNSISTKLMGMLGGGGMAMAGANNVTINVNNPVIRNDNDIRKLANEISKAQASQFRVNGGRLS